MQALVIPVKVKQGRSCFPQANAPAYYAKAQIMSPKKFYYIGHKQEIRLIRIEKLPHPPHPGSQW
jgi:hypothetical protein